VSIKYKNTSIARPSKVTQIGIFGLKIYHLAALIKIFPTFCCQESIKFLLLLRKVKKQSFMDFQMLGEKHPKKFKQSVGM
jgi:hypothetical protein